MSTDEIINDPELFFMLPDNLKDKHICENAVRYNGTYLQYVPEKFITQELCYLAISRSPYVIEYIPSKMKSQELYINLVRESSKNLKGIPAEKRTYEMCQIAFDNTYGKDKNDYSIVGALIFPSMILQILRELDKPENIHILINTLHFNKSIITKEVALEAMRKNSGALNLIPLKAITHEIAEATIKNCPYSIQWVPIKLRTPDMYLYAAKNDSDPNIYIPNNILTGDNICFARKIEARLEQSRCYDKL